jgi:hypothetical protein
MSSSDASVTASPAPTDPDHLAVRFNFENTYARLPERFYARVDPTPVEAPRLVKVNVELARNLGLQPLRGPSLWRSPTPGISLDISCLSSATAAPTCLAR